MSQVSTLNKPLMAYPNFTEAPHADLTEPVASQGERDVSNPELCTAGKRPSNAPGSGCGDRDFITQLRFQSADLYFR